MKVKNYNKYFRLYFLSNRRHEPLYYNLDMKKEANLEYISNKLRIRNFNLFKKCYTKKGGLYRKYKLINYI